MSAPALLAVAHGSPDPRAEQVLDALVARLRASRPDLLVVLAYLRHTAPSVPRAVSALVAQGVRELVAVPLLLGSAYHARVDLPESLAAARREHRGLHTAQAEVLGPHPLLEALALRRLREAGVTDDAQVVLGAIGSADLEANAQTARVAGRLGAAVGFATCPPLVADVVDGLRERGARKVAVGCYVLAPGVLPDRFGAAGADMVGEVLGAAPEVADVVLDRYDAAAARSARVERR